MEQILAWADAWYQRTGQWPTGTSGPVDGAGGETWGRIKAALYHGLRGLPGGSSLAQLLAQHRGVQPWPPLTAEQILAWADAHHQATGAWPRRDSGPVAGAGLLWVSVDMALRNGNRGLPGGSSLPRVLAQYRGVRNLADLPPLTEKQILAWAKAHHARTGRWPNYTSGAIPEAPGESWGSVTDVLHSGGRGLPGGDNLPRLLARRGGVRHPLALPPLTEEQILAWADAHHRRSGRWPTQRSGPVRGTSGETWKAIDQVLLAGRRGLRRSSLARLLAQHRGIHRARSLLTEEQILAWADAHHRRTGQWPTQTSGPVRGGRGETWAGINSALYAGQRGLPGGSSLARLLAQHRGVRNRKDPPPLTEEQILAWADAHHGRTGQWPTATSGPIPEAPGITWATVNSALDLGYRSLPGGSSLARLLARHRGVPNRKDSPPLTEEQILAWADAHLRRTGQWPTQKSGSIPEVPGTTWSAVNSALYHGSRGLPGGSSLTRLLAQLLNGKGSRSL